MAKRVRETGKGVGGRRAATRGAGAAGARVAPRTAGGPRATCKDAPPAGSDPRAAKQASAKQSKRAAILRAGLGVFAEHGFEAARLDEVAQRAGVAKGTLYLYFKDKAELFEEIIRDAVAPVIARFEDVAMLPDLSLGQALDGMFATFATQVLGTDRKLVLRLIIAEGPRFPRIAQFYHREVVSRGLAILRRVAKRAHARGELRDDTLVRFPQLILAGPLLALLWDGLFSAIEPLDAHDFLSAHRTVLTGLPASCRSPTSP